VARSRVRARSGLEARPRNRKGVPTTQRRVEHPAAPPLACGAYDITQLSPALVPEWHFTSTNTRSCARNSDGSVNCVVDHSHGFEWGLNAPAVDANGVVYANGEDGVLYAIHQGGKTAESLFLGQPIGAAYTPVSVDEHGRIYAENLGQLFAVGP